MERYPVLGMNHAAVTTPVVVPGLRLLSLHQLIEYDAMCCRAQNMSEKTISLTALALGRLERFLEHKGLSMRVDDIGPQEIRALILHLQQSPRFKLHPYVKQQPGTLLTSHCVNTYLRAIRAAWNRWKAEGLVESSPFEVVRLPRVTRKVMPTLSPAQLKAFFGAIDTKTPEGLRDYVLLNFYLDTTCRLSEVTNLEMENLDIQARRAKVMGKGRRERFVFFGTNVQKALWKYVSRYRPEPQLPVFRNVFLTHDGRPLSKNRVEAIVKKYALKANITGVRISPHTLRHTACLMWIKNGGDLFSLQAMTGHSSIETTRGYVNLDTEDVQQAHRRYSPVDYLQFAKQEKGPARPSNKYGATLPFPIGNKVG